VPVYKCDEFRYRFGGLSDDIFLEPDLYQREEDNGGWVYENLRGVIVYAKDGKDNEFSEFVSFKKLEQLRMQSEFQDESFEEYKVSKNGKRFENIWYKWAEEMYKAKALKYVITRLPIDDKVQEVVVLENKEDIKQIEKDSSVSTTEELPAPKIDGLETQEPVEPKEPTTSNEAREFYNEAKSNGDVELTKKYANLYKELKAKEVKNGNS
jgi:recombination protein RecT